MVTFVGDLGVLGKHVSVKRARKR